MDEPANGDPWSPAHHPEAIAVSEGQWTLWTLDLCAHRVRTGNDPHRQIDARVFVFMLRQLLYAAEMQHEAIRPAVRPEIHAAFRRACAAFEQAIPGLVAARDILTHFNEYAVGDGRLQRKLRKETGIDAAEAARRFWGGGYDPSTGEFIIGPHRIHIERALGAAHMLGDAIYAAAKEVDFARERKAEVRAGVLAATATIAQPGTRSRPASRQL
jgi:hypothetical protein